MAHPELLVVSLLRALTQIALMLLIGQGALALLIGCRRQDNPVYRLFVLATRPVLGLLRRVVPRQIIDRHLPVVAFFLLFWALVGLTAWKKAYCEAHALACF
jgi:uncharacterized protein YggT (Ycf19 family)